NRHRRNPFPAPDRTVQSLARSSSFSRFPAVAFARAEVLNTQSLPRATPVPSQPPAAEQDYGSGARGRAFLLEATLVPPGDLPRPAVPGCLSAALRRALALGGWPPRVFARADIQPHLGRPDEPRALQATKIGQQYCPMQNMAEDGQLHKSALAPLFGAAKRGRKRRSSLWRRPLRRSSSATSCNFSGPRVVCERKQRSTR